jgi:hypothetical protein
MKKSAINQPPCYFDRYISHADDLDIADALRVSLNELETLDYARLHAIGERVYAPGKWTIRQIFQHLNDSERVLAYRALRIGRNDKSHLEGFDEAILAANVDVSQRSLERVVEDLMTTRKATQMLFETLTDDAQQRFITANGVRMSALAYGFTIAGHQRFHLKLIAEKYYPLAASETA